MTKKTGTRHASYLTPHDLRRLDWAVTPVIRAFAESCAYGPHAYLVGSALQRPDYRDIDVRLILTDKAYKRLTHQDPSSPFPALRRLATLNVAFTTLIASSAGLSRPIDFQFQSVTENAALAKYPRCSLGSR